MTQLDVRVLSAAVLAGLVTTAAPFALGGNILAAGVVAGFLTGRSVLRTEESDVVVALAIGALVVLVSLTRGSWPAIAVGAGVFVGAEIAALGRRFGVDHDAPAAPEVRISATTIVMGLGAAAVVALAATIRASAPIANIALVLGLVLGVVILAVHHLREP